MAISGAFIIVFKEDQPYSVLNGFLFLQISNISFAFGQIAYKRFMNKNKETRDYQIFSLLFLGATLFSAVFTFYNNGVDFSVITQKQWITLFYLGLIASGVGFYLWNYGATKVKAASLAVFNNFKIPLAIAVSIFFFGEKVKLLPFLSGSALIIYALYFSAKKT